VPVGDRNLNQNKILARASFGIAGARRALAMTEADVCCRTRGVADARTAGGEHPTAGGFGRPGLLREPRARIAFGQGSIDVQAPVTTKPSGVIGSVRYPT
jgi:hypothetical protein